MEIEKLMEESSCFKKKIEVSNYYDEKKNLNKKD
jgi:hypothetical protein